MNNFKPSLCPNEKADLDNINYPLFASTKLDGIRCIFIDGKMLSRSLKPIANKQLQEKFKHLKDYSKKHSVILDGELYGERMTFQEITHFVMTEDLNGKEVLPEKLKFYCFDMLKSTPNTPFKERYEALQALINTEKFENIVLVKQKIVKSKKEVEELFDEVLEKGYEGLILKSLTCAYKFGRYTYKSGDAYKVKPFMTFDSKIIGVEERFENTSASFKNELGNSQRHSFKDAMKPTGIAAVFIVDYEGGEQRVNITGDESFRKEIWENRKKYIGKFIEFKGMLVGSKEKVRHPVFIRFRLDKKEDKK
jgi:DNA ligase-1